MGKFQFLVQLLEDHLTDAVVFSLLILLHFFATFAYYEINRFVVVTT